MANGNTGLAEAYSVPIKPTTLPRPTVSDLEPRRRAAAPVAPKIEPFPKDFITGEAITQELNEKYNALQTFMGEMWGTYGINPRKPDPGSQAGIMANQKYQQLYSDLMTTAQRAKNERQAQVAHTKSILSGSVEGEKRMEGMTFQQQAETAMVYAPHVGKVTRFNQSVPLKIYDKESLGVFNERRNDTIKTLEEGREDFKAQTYTDAQGNVRLAHDPKEVDTFFDGLTSTVRTPVLDVGARVREARVAKEAEVPADIKRAIDFLQAEKNPTGYTFDVTKKYKTREGTIIEYENVIKNIDPDEAAQFDPKKARINEIYERTPIDPDIIGKDGNVLIPEYHILSKDKKYYLFAFEGGKHKILPVGEAARNLLLFGGYFATTTIEGKAMEYLETVERGKKTKIAPTEKAEVPTKKGKTYIFNGKEFSYEQLVKARGKELIDKSIEKGILKPK